MSLAFVEARFAEAAAAMVRSQTECGDDLMSAAVNIAARMGRGGTLFVAGNGGSAAQAQHLAAELVVKMGPVRRALPSVALGIDPTALTATGNDFSFADVFSRQVEALCRPDDILLAISTSGRSANLLRAVEAAREIGALTVGMTGSPGRPMVAAVDQAIRVPSSDTARIQEVHALLCHVLVELVEQELIPDVCCVYLTGHRKEALV